MFFLLFLLFQTLLRLYLNMAVINVIHLKQYTQCLYYCREALYIDRDSAKALYLRGKVCISTITDLSYSFKPNMI